MTNEAAFFVLMIVDLAFVLFCFRMGKHFLYVAVISNIMFTNMISSNLVIVFGFEQTIANATYAAIFLATDLLSEHYGKKEARKAVWMGFSSLFPLIILAPIIIQFSSSPLTLANGDALSTLFSFTPRIALASMAAYLVAQNIDVTIYHWIKNKYPGRKMLWLRNNGSTMFSQFVDQLIFSVLAFAFAVPFNIVVQIFIAGFVIKILVAVIDTPFLYLSYVIKPAELTDSSKGKSI